MKTKNDRRALVPLGALAAGFSIAGAAMAQQTEAPAKDETVMPAVRAKAGAERSGNQSIRTTTTTIGKGQQQLRDIPQSVTVVTEKLIDDRNLDTLKETLKNTAGVTFMAAEGGEEDIRLRGFSLAQAGDIYVDGMREPAFYERDTFNYDRLELLRGSASLLFGRGSTGGVVNQVSKMPMLSNEHEVRVTLGNHAFRRVTGDFNIQTGDESALRLNAMYTTANNNGAGSSLDKGGIAGAFRTGIATSDEFTVALFHLNNNNGMNYGLPWIKPTAASPNSTNTLLPGLKPDAYYGAGSDSNDGAATIGTLSHLHRFNNTTELRTTLRKGRFERDQTASTIRFAGTTPTATNPFTNPAAVDLTNFGRSTVLNRGTNIKIQDLDTLQFQSDFSTKFAALGVKHDVLAGVDVSRDEKVVYRATLPTGVALVKGQVRVDGTELGNRSVDESLRVTSPSSRFEAHNWGVYAQDMVQLAPAWKVVAGLRYDSMKGDFDNIPVTGATTTLDQNISAWSRRFGVLFQPTELHSFHLSYGTSFNTSGDTYSYAAAANVPPDTLANTPPEKSENIELGAKLDSADNRFTTRLAIFRSTKKNERNTDPTTVTGDSYLLTGKRHATGFELDVTGRITPKWEVYGSYMWMPSAKVDKAASATFGNREGDRPGLTPKHSGTIWTTYQVLPQLRLGVGVNFRSKQSPADITVPAGADPSTAAWKAPGWATYDLMGEYTVNDKVSVKLNVINVTDKYYADSLYRGHYIPGFGRLVQAQLISRF